MANTLHSDRIEKNSLVLKESDDFLRFVGFYCWSIPLNPEYGATKASNIFIDSFKFQDSFLG